MLKPKHLLKNIHFRADCILNTQVENYYTHANNGKIRTKKEAMKYFAQINFEDNDYVYEEKNKSNGCGGAK